MEAPKAVKKAAAGYLKEFPKAYIKHLGQYEGAEAFLVVIPYEVTLGWPPVYLYNGKSVRRAVAFDALEVISALS